MVANDTDKIARDTMLRFAQVSGLTPRNSHPVRYLWTDAYAVCNFLAVYRRTDEDRYLQLALDLVKQVHETLGRHREDDERGGWISGLDEDEGYRHPTAGGLRIGKLLPDKQPYEPEDADVEWDRDGQYFHYLTKWMHALRQVSKVTGDKTYIGWACELGKVAYRQFCRRSADGSIAGLYWKMSVDLTYPVVSSMGHHDPLDGYVTFLEIDRLWSKEDSDYPACDLSTERHGLQGVCEGSNWVTSDILGIGGLLFDANRLMQLPAGRASEFVKTTVTSLLEASLRGINHVLTSGVLEEAAVQRLAFRELGLSIGLHAVPMMRDLAASSTGHNLNFHVEHMLEDLGRVLPVAHSIEDFWLHPANRRSRGWLGHENINMVMLATSLMPEGVLEL